MLLLPAQARKQGPDTACQSNLKNLATALEMWSSDHRGHYPRRLDHMAWFEPSWSPGDGLAHRRLREYVPLPRPVRGNYFPPTAVICSLVILASSLRNRR